MTWQQSLVLGLLAALVALLIQGKLRPALLFSGAVLITYLSGLADINAVVAGYTNSALLTLVLLLLVSLAVEKTRVMSWFSNLVGTGSFTGPQPARPTNNPRVATTPAVRAPALMRRPTTPRARACRRRGPSASSPRCAPPPWRRDPDR